MYRTPMNNLPTPLNEIIVQKYSYVHLQHPRGIIVGIAVTNYVSIYCFIRICNDINDGYYLEKRRPMTEGRF